MKLIHVSPVIVASLSLVVSIPALRDNLVLAAETQPVRIRFAARVGNQPFACGTNYLLGKPASQQTLSDFRFYVSDLSLIDASGKVVPVALEQDGKWQHQTVALLDFENKTAGCANGTTELRDQVMGRVPKGNYTGVKFTLGVPFNLNHADTALAASPLNLTGLWWNWQLGYKFARIDLQRPSGPGMMPPPPAHGQAPGHGHGKSDATGFPIHLGSTGCQSESGTSKPKNCASPNRATVVLNRFDPAKNLVVADLAQLLANTNLTQNQAKTAPGCMSEPSDRDCTAIMARLGLPFMGQPPSPQTFFRVE
jgi:uncharacterized repeat protein (TIGR04052 family)